jgi:dimethylamine monooxygenase subunit A
VSIFFHNDPFTPCDRQETPSIDSPGFVPGNRRCVPIPDGLFPTAVDAVRLRIGARALDVGQWVSVVDDDWAPTIAMKRALIAERPQEVVACLEGAQEACEEVAAGVLASIGATPSMESGIDALVDAALHVADDLCILLPDEHGVPRLVAAVLCAPNRWRLVAKMGGTMASIHSPVARYEDDVASPVNSVMMRLNPERPLWRTNWGISNHPALFQPETPPVTPNMDAGDMWFRVEWQTLRRLPITGGILFTIRTYVEKLSDFVAREKPLVQDIAELVNKIPEDVAVYKSIAPYREKLFAYFETR